jgi:hypothetical protein
MGPFLLTLCLDNYRVMLAAAAWHLLPPGIPEHPGRRWWEYEFRRRLD